MNRILIFSDSQAALRALSNYKVTCKLVAECQDALLALANLNEVTIICVALSMKRLTSLPDRHQQHRHLVQSRLLECLSVCQEKKLRTGLSSSTLANEYKCQAVNMANYM